MIALYIHKPCVDCHIREASTTHAVTTHQATTTKPKDPVTTQAVTTHQISTAEPKEQIMDSGNTASSVKGSTINNKLRRLFPF